MSSRRLPPKYMAFLCANNLMHGRRSLRVTDEFLLDKNEEITPKAQLTVVTQNEGYPEVQNEDKVEIAVEEKKEYATNIQNDETTEESVTISMKAEDMGLLNSKKYDEVVPATQDREEYELVIEEESCTDKGSKILDNDEIKKKLFELYGDTTLKSTLENPDESKVQFPASENGTPAADDAYRVQNHSNSKNNAPVENKTPKSLTKTRLFEELKSGFPSSGDEPTQKRRKIQRKSVIKLPLPVLPDDFYIVLQTHGLKGFNKCNDELLGSMKISGRDFNSLRGSQFLNDTVIDKYLELISKRSTEHSNYRKTAAVSCFFPICLERRNVKNSLAFFPKNTFECDLLLMPTNEDSHWYLFVADFVNLTLFCYDSLDITTQKKAKRKQILEALKALAENENREIDWNEWSDVPTVEQVGPMQDNGCDCGVYVLQYAERISRNVDPNMCDAQMPNYRKRMIYELLQGQLLPPSPC